MQAIPKVSTGGLIGGIHRKTRRLIISPSSDETRTGEDRVLCNDTNQEDFGSKQNATRGIERVR